MVFLSFVKSHRDLSIALERLRDSYKELLVGKPVSDADGAVLMGVEITLREAKNVRELNLSLGTTTLSEHS